MNFINLGFLSTYFFQMYNNIIMFEVITVGNHCSNVNESQEIKLSRNML